MSAKQNFTVGKPKNILLKTFADFEKSFQYSENFFYFCKKFSVEALW